MKNVGNITPFKGHLGSIQIRMWDALPECVEECPNWDTCPDSKVRKVCELRRKYIQSIFTDLNPLFKKDKFTRHKAGMLLIPLYTQLINFKLAAHSTQYDIYSGKGKINPVFKEMRETIKLINSLLTELRVEVPNIPGGKEANNRSLVNGDSDLYESLLEDGGVPA